MQSGSFVFFFFFYFYSMTVLDASLKLLCFYLLCKQIEFKAIEYDSCCRRRRRQYRSQTQKFQVQARALANQLHKRAERESNRLI
jgi:hypothetical protein